MEKKRVKAKEGLIVRDYKTGLIIPESGLMVNIKAPYWMRRIKDGDVVVSETVAKKEPVKVMGDKD